jgi:hypothetical protein
MHFPELFNKLPNPFFAPELDVDDALLYTEIMYKSSSFYNMDDLNTFRKQAEPLINRELLHQLIKQEARRYTFDITPN